MRLHTFARASIVALALTPCIIQAALEANASEIGVSVAKGARSAGTITLRNTGEHSVRILDAEASCSSCTQLEWMMVTVPPGKSTLIRWSYGPHSGGDKTVDIVITTDEAEQDRVRVRLRISGTRSLPQAHS